MDVEKNRAPRTRRFVAGEQVLTAGREHLTFDRNAPRREPAGEVLRLFRVRGNPAPKSATAHRIHARNGDKVGE